MTLEGELIKIPDYICLDLFEKALKNGFDTEDIVISEIKITMGSKSGDNYCSDIYRANINYKTNGGNSREKQISLIVKAMPFTPSRGVLLDDLEVYEKEIFMYTDTLPKMSALLNNEFFGAKCFYTTMDPVKIIIFEDLVALGYVMADRTNGLDERHCEVVLEKLGKFHAASMILAEKDVKSFQRFYSYGIFRRLETPQPQLIEAIFGGGLNSVIEVVKTWDPSYSKICKKLELISDNYLTKIENHVHDGKTMVNILNHGDLWVNNMLFKYDENGKKPIEVVFVDYQMSYWSSPGIDLNYFLSTSPTNGIRQMKRDQLINIYYKSMVDALCSVGAYTHILSLCDVRKEIHAREFYGLAAAVGILPLVLLDKNAVCEKSFDALTDEKAAENLQRAMYFGASYQETMKLLLSRFDRLHDPKIMNRYKFGFIKVNTVDVLDKMFCKNLSKFIEVVRTWPEDEYKSIIGKLENLEDNFYEKLKKHANFMPTEFKVLNHGDLWVNNMLFKYDEKRQPIGVVFVDYQMCYWSSAGIDLNYFLNTSSNRLVREHKRDQLTLNVYYKTIVKTFYDYGEYPKIPSWKMISDEISSRELYGFFAALCILPMILLNKDVSKDSNIENLTDESESKKLLHAMFTGKDYVTAMKFYLKRFDKLKVFDNVTI